jgi:uncharacterized membrane protein YkgB
MTPDDGQRNCPKHVEFHFENKFEKLVHLVGFIVRKFIAMHGHMDVKNSYCFSNKIFVLHCVMRYLLIINIRNTSACLLSK